MPLSTSTGSGALLRLRGAGPALSAGRYGLLFGRVHITWYDLWAQRWCFEFARSQP